MAIQRKPIRLVLCGARRRRNHAPSADGAVILFSSYRSNPILYFCGELATKRCKNRRSRRVDGQPAAVLNPVVVATNSNNKRKHQKRLRRRVLAPLPQPNP